MSARSGRLPKISTPIISQNREEDQGNNSKDEGEQDNLLQKERNQTKTEYALEKEKMRSDMPLWEQYNNRLLKKYEKAELENQKKENIIKFENINKTYLIGIEGVTAVRGVSCSIKPGEFVIILGTSGGGKSSILNIMGTIDTPSSGNLKLFGNYMRKETSDSAYAKIRLEKIGFVFQSFNLISSMTSLENVELPMLLRGRLSKSEIRSRAKGLLEKVNLKDRMNHYPNMLSGGEQQRVTIARALSNKPELLLLDEPTGDLDTANSDNIMQILLKLREEENITMVMITHDEYMKRYANRVLHVMDGKISREEIIKDEVNIQAMKDLEQGILDQKKDTEGVGVRTGASGGMVEGITETRTPNDYPMYSRIMEQMGDQVV